MTRMRVSRGGANTSSDNPRLRCLLVLAGAAVWWERLWPRLWPTACIVGGFVAIALMDVLPQLPGWLHALVLSLFGIGTALALAWAVPALRPIPRIVARRRLERDSGIEHRPLTAVEDRMAAGVGDVVAAALWRRHRERMAAAVQALRVGWPHTDIARHEPWGIRAGVLLLLAVGLAAGWRDPGARVARAFDPGLYTTGTTVPALVELWITPPAYTHRPPVFLTTASPLPPAAPGSVADPVQVPRGSALLVRAAGMARPPRLQVVGTPTAPLAFTLLSGDGKNGRAYRSEATIEAGERITVRSGGSILADWAIKVIPDLPPAVTMPTAPKPDGNGLLAITYEARDDYGVADLAVRVEPAVGAERETAASADSLRVPLLISQPGGTQVTGTDVLDLSDQSLAGQPVRLRVEATDGAEQAGVSDWAELILPERTFSHPVAQALIELRKRLGNDADSRVRTEVANELVDLGTWPERFGNDVVVSLAIAVSRSRLILDASPDAVPSVRALLWETALRVEQGNVPFAERRLEEAQQRLMQALRRDAPQGEIEALMTQLQQALDAYLAAAAAELTRRGQQAMPLGATAPMLQSDDLRQMLETVRQLARAGGRDAAMQMLSELQRMLDGIRSGLRAEQSSGALADAQAIMKSLRDLSERQQRLLDDSFQKLQEQASRHAEQGGRSQPELNGKASNQRQAPGKSSSGQARRGGSAGDIASVDAGAQQSLRQDLGELMLKMDDFLGDIPAPLGEADQAMRSAVDALQQGRLGQAVPDQSQAAAALLRALDATGRAMAQRLGGMIGMPGPGAEGDGSGDPFGRSANGRRGLATGEVPIPDRAAMDRAQEILGELRRRAAERYRPAPELDYIERLLHRF